MRQRFRIETAHGQQAGRRSHREVAQLAQSEELGGFAGGGGQRIDACFDQERQLARVDSGRSVLVAEIGPVGDSRARLAQGCQARGRHSEGVKRRDHPLAFHTLEQIRRERVARRVRQNVRTGFQRTAHRVDFQRVRGDSQAELVRFVRRGRGHLRREQRIARIESQLDESRACSREPRHGFARLVRRRELEALPVLPPALRRISARRREERAGESRAQRPLIEAAQRFLGGPQIEHACDAAAELLARDQRHVARHREVHVRVDDRRHQRQAPRAGERYLDGEPRRAPGDERALDAQGTLARTGIRDLPSGEPSHAPTLPCMLWPCRTKRTS